MPSILHRKNHPLRGLAWLTAFGFLMLTGCAAVKNVNALPPSVEAALQRADMPDSVLGVVAYPLSDRASGLRLNADEPRQPGSTMKLVTTIVALERLGTNARFGESLASLDDVNGNGSLDLAVAAPGFTALSGANAGAVFVLDGVTGATLRTFTGMAAFDALDRLDSVILRVQ
ncbi:MAG TPA: D-alanyl-D-alanine carboxypeptidase, partial [Rhodoferax sp.]|nr:D-alanyl-D-alanine carboxypeptidase [Rhodoferax sp.]